MFRPHRRAQASPRLRATPRAPLGAIVDYVPSLNETLVCLGIWALGLLLYTIMLRMAVPILQGRLSKANEHRPAGEFSSVPVRHS